MRLLAILLVLLGVTTPLQAKWKISTHDDTAGNRITQVYKTGMPEPSNTTYVPYLTTNTAYTYLQVGTDNFMVSANLVSGWWKSGSNKLQEVQEYSTFSYDDQARRQFEDRYDLEYYDSNAGHNNYGTTGGNYAGTTYGVVETVAAELYDGESPVRAYQQVVNTVSGNSGNLSTFSSEYVRGSDWGGGIGGVLYSLPASGNLNNASFYNYDGRGDVVALTSNVGNVTYGAAYDAYGKHGVNLTSNVTTTGTQEVGTDADAFRTNTREEWVSADGSSFVDERHRIRNLDTDTYNSRDPLGQGPGPNWYTYVNQNEWTKTDPEGEFVGIILALGFQVYDSYEYATGGETTRQYSANSALNVASIAADAVDGEMGGGELAAEAAGRGFVKVAAKTAAQGAVKSAIIAADVAAHAATVATSGGGGGSGGNKPSGDATDSKPPEQKPVEKQPETTKDADSDPSGKTQEHHSDPKFMGGDPNQPTTTMPVDQHQELHQDLNDFLKDYTDGKGNDMSPRRGNSGANIRENFSAKDRIKAMFDFYKEHNDKYPEAAKDFSDQHPQGSK
jgi:hypothetical protein